MDSGEINARLSRLPFLTIDETTESLDANRDAHGIYTWWLINPDVLPAAPATPYPDSHAGLLYLGIGPASASSRRTLRQRFRDHATGDPGRSTLRCSLASLLWRSHGWTPIWTDRATLSASDNAQLTEWMRENLRVRWVEAPHPWQVEPELVNLATPPLNIDHNRSHPFYAELRQARSTFRETARAKVSQPH